MDCCGSTRQTVHCCVDQQSAPMYTSSSAVAAVVALLWYYMCLSVVIRLDAMRFDGQRQNLPSVSALNKQRRDCACWTYTNYTDVFPTYEVHSKDSQQQQHEEVHLDALLCKPPRLRLRSTVMLSSSSTDNGPQSILLWPDRSRSQRPCDPPPQLQGGADARAVQNSRVQGIDRPVSSLSCILGSVCVFFFFFMCVILHIMCNVLLHHTRCCLSELGGLFRLLSPYPVCVHGLFVVCVPVSGVRKKGVAPCAEYVVASTLLCRRCSPFATVRASSSIHTEGSNEPLGSAAAP